MPSNTRMQQTAFGTRDRCFFDAISCSAPRRRLMRNPLDRAIIDQDKRDIIIDALLLYSSSAEHTPNANQKDTVQMHLPHYYLPRPPLDLDASTLDTFEALWMRITNAVEVEELSFSLPIPRWQFLCYLADHKPVVLHGSANPHLSELEPRQTNDVSEFGNRCAIYAASDGIWPMYFAILDREQYPMSLTNACFRVLTSTGTRSEPFYFFSISQTALQHQPWHTGNVYILPSTSFEQQPPLVQEDTQIQIMQCASAERVKPLAKISVAPNDFPFLSQIRGHDDTVQWQRARENPNGFPWIEDEA